MAHKFSSLLLIALIIILPLPVTAQASVPLPIASQSTPAGPTAPDTFSWYNGRTDYSTILNCASIIQGFPYQEYGAGTYVGFYADLNAGKPAINAIYYVHVVITVVGNSCSGGMRAFPDLVLPTNTTLANGPGYPVNCFVNGSPISPASDCPQILPPSPYHSNAYAIPSTDGAHGNTWTLPQGYTLEIQIPVKSSTALSNSTLEANVLMLDGNSSPSLLAQQGVYVFSGLPALPTIDYPILSTTAITTTSAHSEAYVYTYGAGGIGYFDLGLTNTYGYIHEMVTSITAGFSAWVAWDEWGPPYLTPDTLYHWRFTFTPSGGSTVLGADQTFRTLPDGLVTIGQAGVACTDTAFNSALATAKKILFDCGPLPVTFTLSSTRSITSDLTIDGGNKVTIQSNGLVNHFNVQGTAHLTLTQITLSNGMNTTTCGGAINVASGAFLTLNEVRLLNNHSNLKGGAICNQGTANITAALFKDNSSNSPGGAIQSSGVLIIADSRFDSNTAVHNGGGIDMGGIGNVTNTIFINNTGRCGGGINNYGGTLTVDGSSFIGNTATLWGGGLANDSSTTTVLRSSFSGNSSANVGGGLETSGSGSLTIINTTVSANYATNEGGGLFWYPGVSTGLVYLVNNTIASNQAGTQGGNIYTGGIGIYNADIHMLMTIVASGSPNNCSGSLNSFGYNLENTNTCGLAAAGDKINTNPKLGRLQNNGGSTLTQALLVGSPAIDTGDNPNCSPTDQRGVVRPLDGNRDGIAVCDIGAFEGVQWLVFLPLTRK